MKVTVGTAPDSWGVWFPEDPRQMPWQRFLDEVKEAGYEWIELGPYGYLPTDLALLRSEVDKRGLKVSGAFVIGDFANPAVANTLAFVPLTFRDLPSPNSAGQSRVCCS